MKLRGGVSFRSTRAAKRAGEVAQELKAVATASVKVYFRYPAWLIADIVTTPAWLVLLFLPILLFLPRERWSDPETMTMLFWGWIFWDVVSAGLWSFGNAVRGEQRAGTLEPLLLTNASRAILFSKAIYTRAISLGLSLAYVYAFFTALFNVQVVILDPFGVAASLMVGLLASLGFGLIYGALVFRFKNVGPLNNVLQFVLLGLSGAFFPVASLPEFLRPVSYALPYTYPADLLRYYSMSAPTLLPLHLEWLVTAAYTLSLLTLGVFSLKLVETLLKRTGQLGTY